MLLSLGFLQYLTHDFDRTLYIEALMWTHVQSQCDGTQLFLAVYRQVHSLGQVLSDKAVDVIVATTLPRAVRVKEVDRHAGLLGALRVYRHLLALVVGYALAHCQRHAIERRA